MKGTTNVSFICVLIIIIANFECINSAPVQRRSVSKEDSDAWLRQFGYMTATNPTTGEYTDAMVEMQDFYNLTRSGNLDYDTEEMMKLPRCGIKDFGQEIVEANCTGQEGSSCRRRRFTTLGSVWNSPFLTYRFNNYSPDLSRSQIQSAIQRALGIWAEVAPISFSLKGDGNSVEDASDIEVSFGTGNHGIFHPADGPFDGPSSAGGTVLAHAFNPGSTRFQDLRGDMHFDEDEFWQDGAGIDLFTVAAHEFGHSLGLGHSNVRGALMFPTYFGFDPNFRLHDNDIQGIQSLYGVRQIGPDPTTRKVTTAAVTTASPTTSQRVPGTKATPETSRNQEYCQTSYDSITTLYSAFDDVYTVVSKMNVVARFATEDAMVPEVYRNDIDTPSEIQATFGSIWNDSESSISAVLEKQDRSSLIVIRGSNYWEYDVSQSPPEIIPTFPKLLSNLGLPDEVTIVAALSNKDQDKIHLFSEDMFWSFDGNLRSLNAMSPQRTSGRWPGVPDGFDAAFSWQGNSYFVKGSQYWLFNETASEVGPEFPRSFNKDWLGCYSSTYIKSASVILSFCCLLLAVVLPQF